MTKSKTQRISAPFYLGVILASCSNQSNYTTTTNDSTTGLDGFSESSSSSDLGEIHTLTSDSSTSENSSETTFFGSGSISESGTTSESETSESETSETGTTGIDLAVCGDNFVSEGEECEANQFGELCLNCKRPRYVFVTYPNYQGNFGGIIAADEYCEFAAANSNLKGTFKAWLTDGNKLNQPFYRFKSSKGVASTLFDGYYIYPGINSDFKKLIFTIGWKGLEKLDIRINVTSDGEIAPDDFNVWTNTSWDGAKVGEYHCNNWTSNENDNYGAAGHTSEMWGWSYSAKPTCEQFASLYCFQVE